MPDPPQGSAARALAEAEDWALFYRLKTEEAEAEIRDLEDTVDDLKTRLILRQEELLRLYRAAP